MAAYPWGEKGTKLEEWPEGPDQWQTEELKEMGRLLQARNCLAKGEQTALQMAYRAGHGVGKTAFVAWIIHWFISTRPDPQIVVTAGTAEQLNGKTWRELAKWKELAINGHWFSWSATRYSLNERPETWTARAVAWSVHRADAFAGTHDEHVLIIFDEGSAIDKAIYEVVSGALTTPGAIMLVVGNPTKNSGPFHEIFTRFAHRWHHRQIDARKARMANIHQLEQWIADYGEDSDFARVRIYGDFPRASSNQFISSDIIAKCMAYEAQDWHRYAVIIGCDVARFGDDSSVITVRQGRKRLEKQKYQKMDLVRLADKVAETANHYSSEEKFKVYIIVDGDGVGGGLVDILRSRGFEVIDVNSGATADDPEKYYNKKAEMSDRARQHMMGGVELRLPDGKPDTDLESQMLALEYGFSNKNQIQMEKKADMKKRTGCSPDDWDSYALTYAVNLNDAEALAGIAAANRFVKAGGGMTTTDRWRSNNGGMTHGRNLRRK